MPWRAVVFHDGDGLVKSVPGRPSRSAAHGAAERLPAHFLRSPVRGPACVRWRGASPQRRSPSHQATMLEGRRGRNPSRCATCTSRSPRGDDAEAALALVSSLLADSTRHVLLYTASADQAADLGDFLAVHGYDSGPPGDATVPVWLSPGEEDDARDVLEGMDDPARVATISCGVPPGADSARTRHCGAGGPAWALPAVRELGHLRQVASEAGMKLKRVRPRPSAARLGKARRTRRPSPRSGPRARSHALLPPGGIPPRTLHRGGGCRRRPPAPRPRFRR